MKYCVGVDIGSTAAKVAVLTPGFDGSAQDTSANPTGCNTVVYTAVEPTGYSGIEAADRIREKLEDAGYPLGQCCVTATGYGRVSVPYAEKTVTEITCHGRGAAYLFGDDGVVVDIGGQDTKVIVLRGGLVQKFNMNDKCSAGTGKFLEIMANRMGVSQEELSALARAGNPTQISSMCTVFAESEVISLIAAGTSREDIAWGVIESVAAKVRPLIPRVDNAQYFLTGGLCENDYFVKRLAAQLASPVKTCPQARFAGAIGAALSA